jgi:hypothetical protein
MKEVDWPEPYGFTQFCDDIRQEVDGKISLIGVYGADLVLPDFPATILQLCIMIRFFESEQHSDMPLDLHIYFPGDADESPTQRINIPGGRKPAEPPPETADISVRLGVNLFLKFPTLTIKEEGRIKVRMLRGDTSYRLGAIRVRKLPQVDIVSLTRRP